MKNIPVILILLTACLAWPAQKAEEPLLFSYSLNPDLRNGDTDENGRKTIDLFVKISRLGGRLNQTDLSDHDRKEISNQIISLLKSAAEAQSGPKMKLYLTELSKGIEKGDFHSGYNRWIDLEPPDSDILIQTDKDKKMDILVLFYDRKWNKKAARYVSLVDKLKANSTRKYFSVQWSDPRRYPIWIADLLDSSGNDCFSVNYPPSSKEPETGSMRIIVFRNMARIFFRGVLKPLSDRVFLPRRARMVDFSSYLSNLIMHKISHVLGPYFVKSNSEEPVLISKKLKDLFVCIEEIKADTAAVNNTKVLIKEKIVSEKRERQIYTTYIAALIAEIRQNPAEGGTNHALIQFNYYLKNQALIYNLESQVLTIDYGKLKQEVKRLMDAVLRIEQSGSYPGAKQFIKEHSIVPPELAVILTKLDAVPVGIKAESKGSGIQSD